MIRQPVIFLGPSLKQAEATKIIRADYRPPVRCGDVFRAVQDGAGVIGIIDGVFETERSVWHKEILWALKQGAIIYGGASMGALRAVELAPFGMQGFGRIYEWYMEAAIEDDEEVAVLHAPEEMHHMALTDPTVNVRATLERAREEGVITLSENQVILQVTRSIYYKQRSRQTLFEHVRSTFEDKKRGRQLTEWMSENWIDQKREDAKIVLMEILNRKVDTHDNSIDFTFQETGYWKLFESEFGC